jgi:tetraacyldisaccharide 4'-kinase
MQKPDFWTKCGLLSNSLIPASWLYNTISKGARSRVCSWKAPIPVICIGNLTMGGTGKTTVAISICEKLVASGQNPHFLSRGYGRKNASTMKVDLTKHDISDVGDEPLLLAKFAPVWVNKDRVTAAKRACSEGATCIIMDDGFQNPGLFKDYSFLVFDGPYGIGNGRIFPAGPMREHLRDGCDRADTAVIIGKDLGLISQTLTLPIANAEILPEKPLDLSDRKVAAFAGIGRPEKFFQTLREMGADLILKKSFPDHHCFSKMEIENLLLQASEVASDLYTTEKDYVRLPPEFQQLIKKVPIKLVWEDPGIIDQALNGLFK